MKTNRFHLVLGLAAAVAFSGQAFGQPPEIPSGCGPSLSCFYECKRGPKVNGTRTWREITTLMLVNSSRMREVGLLIFDGNENLVAETSTRLSTADLDEINICATLRRATRARAETAESADGRGGGRRVPEAGLIQVALNFNSRDRWENCDDGNTVAAEGPLTGEAELMGGPSSFPVHGWVKNLLGKFFVNNDEPFDGRVTGIAKTECHFGMLRSAYRNRDLPCQLTFPCRW